MKIKHSEGRKGNLANDPEIGGFYVSFCLFLNIITYYSHFWVTER